MTKTIGDLLTKVNLNHKITDNDLILKLPLYLFTVSERTELIVILWLYSEGYCNTKFDLIRKYPLGEHSLKQVERFFVTPIKKEVSDCLPDLQDETLEKSNFNPLTLIMPPTSRWLDKNQIKHWLSTRSVYRKLVNFTQCDLELSMLIQWIETDTLSLVAAENLCDKIDLLDEIDLKRISPKFTTAIAHSKVYKNNRRPLASTYEWLIKLHKYKTPKLPHSYVQVLSYFYNAMEPLVKTFPLTFEALIISLGIKIPDDLDPVLRSLIEKKIHEIPNINDKIIFELLYYVMLLVLGIANFTPNLIHFNCVDLRYIDSLSVITKVTAEWFYGNYQQGIAKSHTTFGDNARQRLTNQLLNNNFSTNPNMLTILFLQYHVVFKKLFTEIWSEHGVTIEERKPMAIDTPHSNQYLIGRGLFIQSDIEGMTKKLVHLNIHDYELLRKMMTALAAYEKTVQSINKNKTEQDFRLLEESEFSKLESIFNESKKQIQDPLLREQVTIANIGLYAEEYVLDYVAIANLINKHSIDANNGVPPAHKDIRELFCLFGNNKSLRPLASRLAESKLIINLDDKNALDSQINTIENKIKCLNDKLKIESPTLKIYNAKLNTTKVVTLFEPLRLKHENFSVNWYQFERHLYIEFSILLKKRLNPVDLISRPVARLNQ